MKHYGLLIIAGIFMTICGCSKQEGNVFYVMFKDNPNITSNAVYADGDEIGAIISQKTGFGNIYEVEISVGNQQMDKMRDDAVFCVSKGRLERHTVQGGGALLPRETPILGFNSSFSLSWYKTKNALKNISMEASKDARELYEKIRWSELKAAS